MPSFKSFEFGLGESNGRKRRLKEDMENGKTENGKKKFNLTNS